MTTDLSRLLIVQGALWAFYALVPCWALRRWFSRELWPVRLALAVLAGVGSQAVLGFFWGLVVRQPARYEGMVYLGFWLFAAMASRLKKPPGAPGGLGERLSALEQAGLGATLAAGFVVRLLHPLRTWALGQSDAYSHLAMFREIIANGFLAHAAYPPGYAWIMAMPAAVLGLDPYHVARFGGAFLGVALVLGVYYFLKEGCQDRPAALAGAFLVACFPGLMLLHKTGIGAFANQAGLFLLPMAFGGVLAAGRRDRRSLGVGVLAGSLAGMLIAVPMMLLHVGMVLVLLWLSYGWKNGVVLPGWVRRRAWAWIAALVLAVAALVRFGSNTLAATTAVLTTADETVAANFLLDSFNGLTSLILLSQDFFSIKRWGLGSFPVDAVFIGLFFLFAGMAVGGIARKKTGIVLLSCWGGLVVVQTATGFLQFTAYQREGWSLLIATGCMGGIWVAWFWSRFRWVRPAIVAAMALSAAATLGRPPAHNLTNSTAEETMVRIARMFSSYPDLPPDRDPVVEKSRRFLMDHLVAGAQISLMTRPLMQELMMMAVAGPQDAISFTSRDIWRVYDLWLERSTQALVLLDRPGTQNVSQLGAFAEVSPAGARGFIQQQRRSYALNDEIESYIGSLNTNEWRVASHDATPQLRLYYVSKIQKSPGPE